MGELLLGPIIPSFKEYTGYVRDAVRHTLESVTSSKHLAGGAVTGRRLRLSSSLANVADGHRTLRDVVQDIPLIRITDEEGMGYFANDEDDFEEAEWEDVDHDSEPTDTTELDNAKRISALIEALDKWDPTLLQRSLEAGADIRWTFKHKGTRLNALEIILLRHCRKDTAILTPLMKQGRAPAVDREYGSAVDMLRVLLGFGQGPCLWDIADTLESILASVGGARNYDELFPVFAEFLSREEGLKKGVMKQCTCFNVDRHKSIAPKEYIDALCNSKPNPPSLTVRRPNGAKRVSKRRNVPPNMVNPSINSLFSKLTSKVAHSRRNDELGSDTFLPILQFFYILGANPNSTFENSTDTLLHFTAVSTKYADIFVWLLDTVEVNLDARNLNGDTTLHLAIRKRSPTAVVSGLLYYGADPNIENAQGRTPLMEAASEEFGVRPQQSPFVAQTMSMPNALPPSAALLAASHSVFTSFANISFKPMKASPLQLAPDEPAPVPEKAHSLYSVNSVGARSLENEGLRKYVKVLLENHASIRSFTVDEWLYLLQAENPQTSIYVQDSGKISFKVLEKPIFTAAGLPDEFIGSGFNSDYTANVRKIILNFKPNTKNLLSTCGPRHVDRAQDRGESQWWTLVTETCGKRPQDCGNRYEHDQYQYLAEHTCKPYEPHTRLTRIGPETHSGSEETHLKMLNKMLSLKFQGGDVQLTNNLIFYYPVSVFERDKWRIVFREMLVSWTMYPCFPDFEVRPSSPTASQGRARAFSTVSAISTTSGGPMSPTYPAWNRPRGLSSATEASAGTAGTLPAARDNSQLLLSKTMRTMSYRSTLKHGFIPDSGVELFTLTIRDLHEKWVDILEECKVQIRHKEKLMLEAKGTDTDFVNVLLSDAQLWNSLQLRLQNQTRRARRLQSQIVNIELLHQELDIWGGGMEALAHLDEAIAELAGNEEHVKRLQEQTRELIQLEFNLVSIMEAKKSAIMNASMKRLSVITFIFLPLMFITGIFGMNIDLISEDPANPKWYWAIILSLITTFVIVAVWLAFKYSSLEVTIERSARTIAKRAREAVRRKDKEDERVNYGESVSDSDSMTWVPRWVRTQTGFPTDLEKGGAKVGVKVD
ncbi:hypothetical protein BJ508DRAFT_5532 [Ascobolus immersus RN42]|uniref:Uncharacterized protein n=1 Tax=Ascobolus immersus RN42 TaxID=1160509 RepID=A0A3N4IRG1_ASCIM|nr:hypothetical protein BJ508DRAFT_5532 [Ascobolus immersus RN42]